MIDTFKYNGHEQKPEWTTTAGLKDDIPLQFCTTRTKIIDSLNSRNRETKGTVLDSVEGPAANVFDYVQPSSSKEVDQRR
jgi:hypothetical protein